MEEPDPCVCSCAPLSTLITDFIAGWNRERPMTSGRFVSRSGQREVGAITAVSWLVEETRRLDPNGRGISEDTLVNIKRQRRRRVPLGMADLLVTALGHPEAFHDGTLEVLPNPSLNGALAPPAS